MINVEQTPTALIADFLLARIAEQPVADRVILYRSFAHETKDEELANACLLMAEAYEENQKRERQLLLNFRQRNP